MKRCLARSPWARMIVGSVSRPARTSAGGGTICSVETIHRRKPSVALWILAVIIRCTMHVIFSTPAVLRLL